MGDVNLVVNKNDAEVQITKLQDISEPLNDVYLEINGMRDKLISYLGDEGKLVSSSLEELSKAEEQVRETINNLISVIQKSIKDAEAVDSSLSF